MPELPEVETVARQLDRRLSGRAIAGIEIVDAKLDGPAFRRIVGRRIVRVYRSGKQVVFELSGAPGEDDGPLYLVVHLRMTGRLLCENGAECREDKHRRAVLLLDEGELRFSDVRRFGTIALADDPAAFQPEGAEPLERSFTAAKLSTMLAGGGQEIKKWLLRQDRIVGLGNIYASEVLHEAGLDPFRRAGDLDAGEVGRLHRSIKAVLRRAIKYCGTTFSDFQDSSGHIGSYQNYLRVYQREGEPCKACQTAIVKTRQEGRSTFYCPRCQR